MKKNDAYKVIFVIADRRRQKLLVPKYVMKNAHKLKSPEAKLINSYMKKYPGFGIEVIDCSQLEQQVQQAAILDYTRNR